MSRQIFWSLLRSYLKRDSKFYKVLSCVESFAISQCFPKLRDYVNISDYTSVDYSFYSPTYFDGYMRGPNAYFAYVLASGLEANVFIHMLKQVEFRLPERWIFVNVMTLREALEWFNRLVDERDISDYRKIQMFPLRIAALEARKKRFK